MAYGGDPRTFAGLAGLGDLVLTCTGGLSRNRQTGLDLAAGKSVAEITSGHTVSEGIRNSIAVSRLAAARGSPDAHHLKQMVAVLHEGKRPAPRRRRADDPRAEIRSRPVKTERSHPDR